MFGSQNSYKRFHWINVIWTITQEFVKMRKSDCTRDADVAVRAIQMFSSTATFCFSSLLAKFWFIVSVTANILYYVLSPLCPVKCYPWLTIQVSELHSYYLSKSHTNKVINIQDSWFHKREELCRSMEENNVYNYLPYTLSTMGLLFLRHNNFLF